MPPCEGCCEPIWGGELGGGMARPSSLAEGSEEALCARE